MTDKQLLKTVTSFRKGILGRKSPLKMCYAVCWPLNTYLNGCGVQNELTEGEVKLSGHNEGLSIGHFWLTLSDGRIIDPTASQFNGFGNEDMPIVYLGEKPKWLIVEV
jgi:hypothetical protein